MNIEQFLAQPLVARVAANGPDGPTVRPVWFLFEGGTFWWLTGSYSRLEQWLADDPRVAITVDTCELHTGQVLAVTATGRAEIHPLDRALATRKLCKYLGDQVDAWPERFRSTLDEPGSKLVAMEPARPPKLRDLSFGSS